MAAIHSIISVAAASGYAVCLVSGQLVTGGLFSKNVVGLTSAVTLCTAEVAWTGRLVWLADRPCSAA